MPSKNGFELGLPFEVEIFVDQEQLPEVQTGGYIDAIKGWLQVRFRNSEGIYMDRRPD